jgi:hypothetical protein
MSESIIRTSRHNQCADMRRGLPGDNPFKGGSGLYDRRSDRMRERVFPPVSLRKSELASGRVFAKPPVTRERVAGPRFDAYRSTLRHGGSSEDSWESVSDQEERGAGLGFPRDAGPETFWQARRQIGQHTGYPGMQTGHPRAQENGLPAGRLSTDKPGRKSSRGSVAIATHKSVGGIVEDAGGDARHRTRRLDGPALKARNKAATARPAAAPEKRSRRSSQPLPGAVSPSRQADSRETEHRPHAGGARLTGVVIDPGKPLVAAENLVIGSDTALDIRSLLTREIPADAPGFTDKARLIVASLLLLRNILNATFSHSSFRDREIQQISLDLITLLSQSLLVPEPDRYLSLITRASYRVEQIRETSGAKMHGDETFDLLRETLCKMVEQMEGK